jgi:hypothetical protein
MLASPNTRPAIYMRQRKWAADRGIKIDANGHTQILEDNLFQPLTAAARTDYASGRGSELGSEDASGTLQSFISSSALVCNVFDYWRSQLLLGQSLKVLTKALGAPDAVRQMQFAQAYPTGVVGISPQLDVVLLGDEAKPFLIEAKFTEPYPREPREGACTKSYFPNSGELWGKYGLTRCEALARRIQANEERFLYLDAPQLLEDILGIVNVFKDNFTLLYLWYDYLSLEAAEHRSEVKTFMQRLNGEIDFRAMTFQDLFKKMQNASTVDQKYITYLAKRYFSRGLLHDSVSLS